MSKRVSAGILLYRSSGGRLEVLLAHMGGPLHASRDMGTWTIPKGEIEPGEELQEVAKREFAEETGHRVAADTFIPLGSVVQKGGKIVHAWAAVGDLNPAKARSNTFRMEWPPGSGHHGEFPEIDRVAWYNPDEARKRVKAAQKTFIDRLEVALSSKRSTGSDHSSKRSAGLHRSR
jgi:predicted NUDIX family NTP pyrophosphohydrolase